MKHISTPYRHIDETGKVHVVLQERDTQNFFVRDLDVKIHQGNKVHKDRLKRRKHKVAIIPRVRDKNKQWYNSWGIEVPGPEWVDYAHTSEDL